MLRSSTLLAAGLLALATTANAANLFFNQDPFANTTALTQDGRQIVKGPGEEFEFNIATDVLEFDAGVFGIERLEFANGISTDLPATGINFVVLQNGGPLGAGGAADAIALQFTESRAGFFIYFNTNLDVARLVYSTDLSDNTADLSILARFSNLNGTAGFAALPTITGANVAAVPEPSSILLSSAGALLAGAHLWVRRRSRR